MANCGEWFWDSGLKTHIHSVAYFTVNILVVVNLMCRWHIFWCPISGHLGNVVIYTKAANALHNYSRTEESSQYCPPPPQGLLMRRMGVTT